MSTHVLRPSLDGHQTHYTSLIRCLASHMCVYDGKSTSFGVMLTNDGRHRHLTRAGYTHMIHAESQGSYNGL